MRSSSLLTTNPILIVLGRGLCHAGLHRWHHRGKLRITLLDDKLQVARCWRDCIHFRHTISTDPPSARTRSRERL